MKYRVARPEDWSGIEECIASTGYYRVVDASTLDGVTVVAEDSDGTIKGCLWAMVCHRHAYLDYFCILPGTHGRVAAKLALYMEVALKAHGVRWVRGLIKTDNEPARKIARAAGMMSDNEYTMMYKELSDGREETNKPNDVADDDRPALPAGEPTDTAVPGAGEPGGEPTGGVRPVLPAEWR